MSSQNYRRASEEFRASTHAAQRVLAIEIAGLGDLVHSLPALWAVRQAYPQAELHCMTRQRDASLLKLTPWIDRVLPYQRGELSRLGYHLSIARALRAQHYDVAINLIGSDYACAVGRLSGAKRHLVRKPGSGRVRRGWHLVGADVVEHPFKQEAMYLQRWKALAQAGIVTATPEFHLNWEAPDEALGLQQDGGPRYIHVSPFSRKPSKEMPPMQMAALLTRLHQQAPDLRVVLSCSSSAREQAALHELLVALPFEVWKIFSGTLNIPQLCALIRGAALHLSGDTGSMHLAWLTHTPSVSWFTQPGSMLQWAPSGAAHTALVIDPVTNAAGAVDATLAAALVALGRPGAILPTPQMDETAVTANSPELPDLLPEYSF